MSARYFSMALFAAAVLLVSGCGQPLDTSYGRLRGESINGTGALAELLRDEGHTVRTAVRLTDELHEWANVIVRFAPYPGPPEREEAAWYLNWLNAQGGRKLIYVPLDYEAESEYWNDVLEHLPKDVDSTIRTRADRLRKETSRPFRRFARKPKDVGEAAEWFTVDDPKAAAQVCKSLEGPWAERVDPAKAAVAHHETLNAGSALILLKGDGAPLAMQKTRFNDSAILVVANGSFLLNAALLKPARRPLALRVAQWPGGPGRQVAFAEGNSVLGDDSPPSVFALLRVPPFGWVAGQLLVLGLAACLARAPRLGRARPEPASGEDRPVAHPEALGALLARTRQADDARAILDAYRRWRYPSQLSRTGPPAAAEGQTGRSTSSESPPR